MSKVVFESGASRSEYALPYHQIPSSALRRLGQRYQLGMEKHGNQNRLKGGRDPAYMVQVYDHVFEHLLRYRENRQDGDDDLGACLWGLCALIEFESRGQLTPDMLKLPDVDTE